MDGENGNLVGVSAMLVTELAFGGGATPTHVPMFMSPVIDAGVNAGSLELDQRGFTRTAGAATDIGAVEYRAPMISVDPFQPVFTALDGLGIRSIVTPGEADSPVLVRLYHDANDDGLFDDSELVDLQEQAEPNSSTRYRVQFTPDGAVVAPGPQRLFVQAGDGRGLRSEAIELNAEMRPSVLRITEAVIGSQGVSRDAVFQGDNLYIILGFNDGDSPFLDRRVRYSIDTNSNGVVDGGDQPFEVRPTLASGEYTEASVYEVDGANRLDAGLVDFLFVVEDLWGYQSEPFAQTVRVYPNTSVTPSGASSAATDGSGRLVTLTINAFGDPLIREADGGIFSLVERIEAPRGLGDVALWTDPEDGLIEGAYASLDGLILLLRDADGAWSFRNLGGDLGVDPDENIVSITQFTSAPASGRVSVIAGANEAGRLFAFEELPGGQGLDSEYALIRLSDELAAGGFVAPRFSELISYRPSWDAWHLAGLDLTGDVISIWRAPGAENWRLDNLSDITGGDRIERGLSVILTAWNGISITGLNAGGEVVSSWWTPQFRGDWRQINLTTAFGGPTLTDAGLTSFYTPWNAQNYVGVDEAGRVTAYWWAPAFGGQWRMDTLTDETDLGGPFFSRDLTSHVASDNTINILGVASDANAVFNQIVGDGLRRIWWSPEAGEGWRIADRIGSFGLFSSGKFL